MNGDCNMVSGANHLPDDIPQYSITLPTEVLTDIFQFFPAEEAVNSMLVTRCFSKLSTPATRYLQELILENRRLRSENQRLRSEKRHLRSEKRSLTNRTIKFIIGYFLGCVLFHLFRLLVDLVSK
ncbi:hypothetical protein Ddc_13726 [Ditylenchus destructor]|nr:hypothetical protein Ddc_13726 [Ditylenchus destructor]